jgi:DNA-binding NarL/FixJ family response regulator
MAASTSSTVEIVHTNLPRAGNRVGIWGLPPHTAGGLLRALTAVGLQGEIADNPMNQSTDDLSALVIATGEDLILRVTPRFVPPALVVIAYIPTPSAAAVLHAYRAQAAAVIDADMDYDHAARIIRHAIEGTTCIPTAIIGEIFRPAPPRLEPHQQALLHALAGGITVAELATRQGRSLRSMRRQLQQLYRLLDVSSLRGALAWHQAQHA